LSGDLAPRRYSEKEAGAILRKAAEMQRAEPSAADPSGFSLAELEEVAREAGIDPAVVRRAASELDVSPTANFGSALAGAPLQIRVETELPGEYPADRFDALVPIIQSASPWQGHAGVVGRSLTWSARADSNTSSLQALIASGRGRTLIRVEERLGGLVGALFGGSVGGGVGAGVGIGVGVGAALGSTLMMVGFPILIAGGSYLAARAYYAAHVRKEREKLQDLLNQLSAHISSVIDERKKSGEQAQDSTLRSGVAPSQLPSDTA
jgi:hypothetical protein